MFNRVEVEFLSGVENATERRIFEKVTKLEFVPQSHLYIGSVDDGEMLVKWDRLQWYHSQPLDKLNTVASIDQAILNTAKDSTGAIANKISGIKTCRELTGWGLKEAKDYCDKLYASDKSAPDNDNFPFF